MSPGPRRARLSALAKINLSLKVLRRRPDGYHELRTVYQTISLADRIDVEFTPSRRTSISLNSDIDIPGNLILRAAEASLDLARAAGRVDFRLRKRIPMGAGLGGGSSDAAAVLLALPVLAGACIPLEDLMRAAAGIGSDVPFFLLGGTAVGVGRGEELYPLPDTPPAHVLLVAPDIAVSTAEAYRSLGRELTFEPPQNMINSFQSYAWSACGAAFPGGSQAAGENDFEPVVFARHPELALLKKKLTRLGARPARMTGSGSALYGFFDAREQLERALPRFRKERVFSISLVSRARYRSMWRRALGSHASQEIWPPRSLYAR